MMFNLRILFLLVVLYPGNLYAANKLEFGLYKLDSGVPGPTLLIIGGIQGDEPGGFNAASLIVTQYNITRGQVWIVPNLNFESIIKRSRGVHGDMNRKFKDINKSDPEFELVEKIKSIINDEEVDLILNLHDGSGFYYPKYINKHRNPNRWGQSLIIDQALMEHDVYGDLESIGDMVVLNTNSRIDIEEHQYFLKNTHTRKGNKEMEKTLTYYAVQQGKPAFGVEASKEFRTHERAYHHLLVIESFMDYMGIGYERSFDLTKKKVKSQIDHDVQIALLEQQLIFNAGDVRNNLHYIPMKKGEPIDYRSSNPLVAVVDNSSGYRVRYGNRHVTILYPQYFAFDNSLNEIAMNIDGENRIVSLGDIVDVGESFKVLPIQGYRVNVIGFKSKKSRNEVGMDITRNSIRKRFSVDKSGAVYRVEIYRDDKFCGMILVNFKEGSVSSSHKKTGEPAS